MTETQSITDSASGLPPLESYNKGFKGIEQRQQQYDQSVGEAASEIKKGQVERDILIKGFVADKPPPPPTFERPEKPPEFKERNPLEAFGGIATLVGVLGGFLTRNPIQTSLNAAAAAMNAYRQNDVETFKHKLQEWKANAEYVEQINDWQQQNYMNVLKNHDLKYDQLTAQLSGIAANARDAQVLAALKGEGLQSAEKILTDRENINLAYTRIKNELSHWAESRTPELEAKANLVKSQAYKDAPMPVKNSMLLELEKGFRQQETKGWSIVQEELPDGKRRQIRYNPNTNQATTLDGQPTEITGMIEKGGGLMGAREAVFTQRLIQAAGQASRDLGNIVSMPSTTTAGPFYGRQQGPGLIDATKENLANKMTDQEAQLYNVRVAGLQRTLSAIEASGLAPQGMLTKQMEAVIFREGDTVLTRLDKLAQSRQIVESAIDVISSNPRVSESEKQKANEALERVMQAVPFTHQDVTDWWEATQKNPRKTLRQVVEDKVRERKDQPTSEAPQQTHRYKKDQIIMTPQGPARVTGGDLDNDPDVEPLRSQQP